MTEEKKESPFEYQIFAAAFNIDGAIERFSKELDPVDVGLVHGQTGPHEIYKNLVSFFHKIGTSKVDPTAFKAWLQSESDIVDAIGGMAAVDHFMNDVNNVTLSTVDSIIKMTIYRANKRRQLDKIQELKTIISNKGQATDKDLARITQLTEQIRELENDLEYDPLAGVRRSADIIKDMDLLFESPPFVPTQFETLNKALGYTTKGGFMRGGVYAIAGVSGVGKSTLAKCLCNHWLDQGETVLFVNFEEAQDMWERVLMTQVTGENVLQQENLDSAEASRLMKKFAAKLEEWGDRLMVRHDPDSLFFEDLEKWLRDIMGHGTNVPSIVVIDTIQSMFSKSGGKARWGEFEQIMVRLEMLAKYMNAVFIITSQQNSNAVKEKREVLNQSDMGGSVSIVQKATAVLILTEMKLATGDDTVGETVMQVQIPKNRITGKVFSEVPPMLQYDDRSKSYLPFDPKIPEVYESKNYADNQIDYDVTDPY